MKSKKKLLNQYKNEKVTLTRKEVDELKRGSTDRALNLIIGFPMLILRDKFGFGSKRLTDFHSEFVKLTEAYNKGYISLTDIWDTLEKETGLKFEDLYDKSDSIEDTVVEKEDK